MPPYLSVFLSSSLSIYTCMSMSVGLYLIYLYMSISLRYLSTYICIYMSIFCIYRIHLFICLPIHMLWQQQLCHSPNQSLASSLRCLQDVTSVALSFPRPCAKQRDGIFYHSIFPFFLDFPTLLLT